VDKSLAQPLRPWQRNANIGLPIGVIFILGIMILPVPPMMMDFLLSISITLAIMILLVGFFVEEALEFSVFPAILLIVTLYRLSLNIATTRLILLKGDQGPQAIGKVIASFGQFVVGGEYIVGLVVFIILVVINFVVITKGSGRIAEVAARFNLDSMPGKQMAIDADLNAGLIGEDEARERRERISKEADFYGAMDGASKFVRGDAVAGIIITVVNILGGLAIGVLKRGMPVSEAAQTYTLLTIGDGLVSQIPALFISTAAGIIVSRAAMKEEFGQTVFKQIFGNPTVLYIASGMLFFFATIPGMPHFSFIVLSLVVGILAYRTTHAEKEEIKEEDDLEEETDQIMDVEPVDLIAMDVGYQLVPLVDVSQGGSLLDRIRTLRKQLVKELGFIVAPIHIKDNLQIGPAEYRIYIKETEVASGEISPDTYMAINPGGAQPGLEGIPIQEPVFGLSAICISEDDRERAQMLGYTVVDAATVIITHMSEVIRQHAHELLTRQDVYGLLQIVTRENPKVVEELTPTQLSLSVIHRVLQNLLEERVCVRDLLTILETLGDYAPMTKEPDLLTEYVRHAMARQISQDYKSKDGTLLAVVLEPQWEQKINQSMVTVNQQSYVALEPLEIQNLAKELQRSVEEGSQQGQIPVLLTSPELRRHVRSLIGRFLPSVAILSYNEITPDTRLQTINR